ncbi:CLUMA_CG011331, isoform A [Clunio marinus]|uniref:Mitochondrial pyruvate carrier n=1 Tax=Clunio marinus TaxID=568069 RepID=A0A1J1ICE3_9DIPT|nr:CLUMA_CG011331, isoform A [Clunio marinus]
MSSRLYKYLIKVVDKRVPTFGRPFWEYEAGPKTIFFWAPLCKWGLVIAGIKDLTRPAELLSAEQAVAIGATGFIYSRFSMVIIPKNYTLLSVNVFVAITQSIQLFRALRYK